MSALLSILALLLLVALCGSMLLRARRPLLSALLTTAQDRPRYLAFPSA
jgi:hypothetical protein